jgi:serine/threonine protein kinase/tetratricopeptide (TPR) repeat protein
LSPSRHEQLEILFTECIALPPAERAAFLDARCGGDADLRARLERLLDRDGSAASLAPIVHLDPPDPPPATIGPYTLGEKLGEGGFGEVYAAEQTSPIRRRVAVKILRAGLDSRAILARFEAERDVLALMDHPGIARVFDAGATEGGRPYVVMERVDGESITAYCDRHALPMRARLTLLVAFCRAVEHAHQKGVIHRDLKPSNLLVAESDGKPVPKVIDFGIAKATRTPAASGDARTLQGQFLGTPEYASPEQAATGGGDVDTRSDVYSLGVVLFQLLTGRLPFDAMTLRGGGLEGLAEVLNASDPPRPSAVVADQGTERVSVARELRGDLDWIVVKALERDRDRRYPSSAALADDLERYLRDEPVSAGPPSTTYRLRKFARRHRGAVAGVAAVALALVAGIAATTWQAVRARHAEEQARRESQISAAVSEFLAGMISGANPEEIPGGERVTVKEMVDRVVADLDAGRVGEPEIERNVRRAIGSTYLGLGLHEEAESQLARAGSGIEARLGLADLAARRGQYERSDSILGTLASEPGVTDDPRRWVRYLQLRAGAAGNLSHLGDADSLYGLAVEAGRSASLDEPRSLAASLAGLADIRMRLGRADEALSLSREAVDLVRQQHRGDHHDVAAALTRQAEIVQERGEYAAAESLHREALAIDRRVFGPRHPAVAVGLSNLGWSLVNAGKLTEAEAVHREAVAMHVATLGEDHQTVSIARDHLATVLQARGRYDEALTLRRDALEANRRRLGEWHEEVGNAYNNLGSTYRLLRRHREAVGAFRSAIAIFERIHGRRHPRLAITIHNLGKTLADAGDHAHAEPTLRESREIASAVFPADHVNLAFFDATYGRTLGALGRSADAERLMRSAHERIVAALGADHPRALEVAEDLADLRRR